MKIEIRFNGVTELVIIDNCSYEFFYSFANYLSKKLNVIYYNQIDGFGDLWWDLSYQGNELVLHYSTYLGIGIYHSKGNEASEEDNEILHLIRTILLEDKI